MYLDAMCVHWEKRSDNVGMGTGELSSEKKEKLIQIKEGWGDEKREFVPPSLGLSMECAVIVVVVSVNTEIIAKTFMMSMNILLQL